MSSDGKVRYPNFRRMPDETILFFIDFYEGRWRLQPNGRPTDTVMLEMARAEAIRRGLIESGEEGAT